MTSPTIYTGGGQLMQQGAALRWIAWTYNQLLDKVACALIPHPPGVLITTTTPLSLQLNSFYARPMLTVWATHISTLCEQHLC